MEEALAFSIEHTDMRGPRVVDPSRPLDHQVLVGVFRQATCIHIEIARAPPLMRVPRAAGNFTLIIDLDVTKEVGDMQ